MAHAQQTSPVAGYTTDLQLLLNMLTYKRPHGSASEEAFLNKFIRPIKDRVDTYSEDDFGNIYATIGSGKSLMVAHVDTVHRTEGTQVIAYDSEMQLVYKSQSKDVCDDECLGADDGAGCWILLQMIEAGVPGGYFFARSEERGGVGSSYAAKHNEAWFKAFDRAIAFDRRDYGDVITHQARGRCCSDAFAEALSDALNATQGFAYAPCDGGIFTDTANLTHLIPECTNLSVAYAGEHTASESLDIEHVSKLRDACVSLAWDTLVVERDVADVDDPWDSWNSYTLRRSSWKTVDDVRSMRYRDLVKWVDGAAPEDVAEIIDELCCLLSDYEGAYEGLDPYDEDSQTGFDMRM